MSGAGTGPQFSSAHRPAHRDRRATRARSLRTGGLILGWSAALLTALPAGAQPGSSTSTNPAPTSPAPVSPPPLGSQPTPVPESTSAPTTADEALARAHYQKGTAAYALGDFAEAARQYETAFRLKLDPALLYNAAQAHRRAGNRQRAIDLYVNLLRVFPDAPNRKLAQQHLDELRRQGDGNPAGTKGAPLSGPAAGPPGRTPTASSADHPSNPVPPTALEQSVPAASGSGLFYGRPWFWVATGVVVAAAVVTGVVLVSRDRPVNPTWGRAQ